MPSIEKPFCRQLPHSRKSGGARRDRTADLLRAKQALSQLSYGPNVVPCSNTGTAAQNFTGCSIGVAKHIDDMRVTGIGRPEEFWWVWEDLNFRPHPYQGCALTN